MATYRVDFYDRECDEMIRGVRVRTCYNLRTVIVTVDDERKIPFELRRRGYRVQKIKSITKQGG